MSLNKVDREVAYFSQLNQLLQKEPRAIPSLLLDLDRLDANIFHLKESTNKDLRIVVKSLPSPALINYIMEKAATKRLMVFHQPFLSQLSSHLDQQADILLGKPMPISTANYFYQTLYCPKGFVPAKQLQWLVDTPLRLSQYLNLAKQVQQKLRINLEIDVGLRRGGFATRSSLSKALELLQQNTAHLDFSGFMGYDPHVAKLPTPLFSAKKSFQRANAFYHDCIQLLAQKYPQLYHDQLTFNGAGSPTLKWHQQTESVLTEVSLGSALVKPTTFDLPSLNGYQPAAFIATPILKKIKDTALPGIRRWRKILSLFQPAFRNAYFIYGGFWKADYCYPPDANENQIFGSSTNQSMVNTKNDSLEVDDYIFLRPRQSEFVFLQFEEITLFRAGKKVGIWPLF